MDRRGSLAWAGVLLAAIASAGTTAAAPSAVSAPLARCATGALRIVLGQGDGGAGHFYVPVRFTNTGPSCRLTGHPRVSYYAAGDHRQVGDAAFPVAEPAPEVVLRPGQTATAWVDQVNVDNYDPEQCGPTAVGGLRVSPPGAAASVLLAEPGARGCARHMAGQHHLTVRAVRKD